MILLCVIELSYSAVQPVFPGVYVACFSTPEHYIEKYFENTINLRKKYKDKGMEG